MHCSYRCDCKCIYSKLALKPYRCGILRPGGVAVCLKSLTSTQVGSTPSFAWPFVSDCGSAAPIEQIIQTDKTRSALGRYPSGKGIVGTRKPSQVYPLHRKIRSLRVRGSLFGRNRSVKDILRGVLCRLASRRCASRTPLT